MSAGRAWREQGCRIAQAVHADGTIVTTVRDREDHLRVILTEPDPAGGLWCSVRMNGRHRASTWTHRPERATEVHAEMLKNVRAACGIGYRVHWRALNVTA